MRALKVVRTLRVRMPEAPEISVSHQNSFVPHPESADHFACAIGVLRQVGGA